MASPTSPAYYTPAQKEFIYGIESVAAGTVAAANLTREACINIVTTPKRQTYEAHEYTGNAGGEYVGSDETQHSADIQIDVPFRVAGFAALALGAFMGNGSEQAITGAGPYVHTWKPSVATNRCNTFTIWHDTGDTSNVLQMVYATISDYSLTVNPAGVLMASIKLTSFFPTTVAKPTITTYIGSTANYPKTRVLGSQGTYTLYSSAGAAYVNNIVGATIGFTRPIEEEPNAQGLNPADIACGALTMTVQIDAQYDGIGAATVYKDYLNYVELGTSTNKHSIVFTNADGNTVTINFWPAKWNNVTLQENGQIIKLSGTINPYNDLGTLNAASGTLTAPSSIAISNSLSTAMTT